MTVTTWRLDMRLKSPQMLRQYMDYRDLTIRELAKRAGLKPAIVGHLHSGKRKTCKPETARAIAEALQAPPDLLFEATSSRVSREVGRAAA